MILSFISVALVALQHAEGSDSSFLRIDPGLIIWTVITFVALLIILRLIAWKPILNSLKERENFIRDSLDNAETARKEAEKLVDENKANLMKAEEEAQKVIAQGREYAEKLKAQILDESKQEAKKMIADAAAEIERRNQEAFSGLKKQVAEIAVQAAEKIIRQNLDKDKQSELITKYIDEISKN